MRIPVKKRIVQGLVRYVVDLRGKAKENKRSFFKTKAEADRFVDSLKIKIKEEQTDPPIILVGVEKRKYLTMKDILAGRCPIVAAQYYVTHEKTLAPQTIINAIGQCVSAKRASGKNGEYISIFENRLVAFLEFCGKSQCHEVTREDIERWLSTRTTWKNITKRGALVDLGTFFNYCLSKSWITVNPCEHIEEIRVEQLARGILTPKQAEIFIRTVAEKDSGLVRYFVDQLFGGLRELEARMLLKNMEHKLHIELPGDDIYEPGFIEWNPTWKAWRDKYPGEYWPIKPFQARLDKLKALAKKEMLKEKAVTNDWWFPRNCLRHSFCSYGSKIWGTGKAAELARHSEAMQKKHYRRPIPLEDAKAFWAILP